nr:hypothetical transcript [Hymenolepis microstoma]
MRFFKSHLTKGKRKLCSWHGKELVSLSPGQYCGNLTGNTVQGTLDCTHTQEWCQDKMEDITTFAFTASSSMLGVTIAWTKDEICMPLSVSIKLNMLSQVLGTQATLSQC